jgi:hypothetical protein
VTVIPANVVTCCNVEITEFGAQPRPLYLSNNVNGFQTLPGQISGEGRWFKTQKPAHLPGRLEAVPKGFA